MKILFVAVNGEDFVKFQDVLQWLKDQQKRLTEQGDKELLQLIIKELVAANNGKGKQSI